jgi:hypothetical protein
MIASHLITLAETYSQHRGLTLATIATYAASDGKFFNGLGVSRSCTVRKAERVVAWFSDHWPADLEWPADIPRPPRKSEAA